MRVHIVVHGVPLCRFSPRHPLDWPDSETYIEQARLRDLPAPINELVALRGDTWCDGCLTAERAKGCKGCPA